MSFSYIPYVTSGNDTYILGSYTKKENANREVLYFLNKNDMIYLCYNKDLLENYKNEDFDNFAEDSEDYKKYFKLRNILLEAFEKKNGISDNIMEKCICGYEDSLCSKYNEDGNWSYGVTKVEHK